MADISELRMNVTALKRVDPYVKDIIDTASHVALYSFNREDNKWEKTEIEGALFVYSRNGQPQNSIIIMNRLNTNNLVEPVVQKLDLQLQAPFLLYRNSRFRIYGIWFYDKDECVRIASLLEKLIEQVPKIENKTMSTPQQQPSSVDIFGMLSKAQEDFKNSSKPIPPDVTSQSVMDFFAKASGGTNKSEPIFKQIFSNPAHSVEHIEKQVRAATPATENDNDNRLNIVESGLARLQTSPEQSSLTPNINRHNSHSTGATAPALMPPTMFTSPATGSTRTAGDPPPEPLTKNQFISAFIYMLRNDPDFVTKLHEAYVKSFSEMVS